MTLWDAVDQFSAIWVCSPLTTHFRDGLAPVKHDPNQPPLELQNIAQALAMFGPLKAQPLLLAQRLPMIPTFPALAAKPATQRWLPIAVAFGFALLEVAEFLRSRLAGYPSLLVPDLAPNATRVRANGFWDSRFPWQIALRQSGFQFKNEPPRIRTDLGFPDQGRAAYAALSVISQELHETVAWRAFAQARQSLGEKGVTEARALIREYQNAVSEERADQVAGDTGMRDATFRRGELERIKQGASQELQEYYDAFAAVDQMIDAIAALISHRVARGAFDELEPFEASWSRTQELRRVRLKASDNAFLRSPYELVKVSLGLRAVSGLVLLSGVTTNWHDSYVTLTADGWLLSGSADVPANP
jgi:hypothetical protein